jgi:hypothetical protein
MSGRRTNDQWLIGYPSRRKCYLPRLLLLSMLFLGSTPQNGDRLRLYLRSVPLGKTLPVDVPTQRVASDGTRADLGIRGPVEQSHSFSRSVGSNVIHHLPSHFSPNASSLLIRKLDFLLIITNMHKELIF